MNTLPIVIMPVDHPPKQKRAKTLVWNPRNTKTYRRNIVKMINSTGTCRFLVIVMHEHHSRVYGANLNSIDERIKPERSGLDMKMLTLKTKNMMWLVRFLPNFTIRLLVSSTRTTTTKLAAQYISTSSARAACCASIDT